MSTDRWTLANVRHVGAMFVQGRRPAARVYDSIGTDFFLAPAPGWLNLGLWEGPGTEDEAEDACRRLVETVAAELPSGGVVVDAGNGLAVQDPVIAAVLHPSTLLALNITESQLRAGSRALAEAGAVAVLADATRMPVADQVVDGVISVEAAFHFPSRLAFFREVRRVLCPGGVLSMSDVSTERRPRTLAELAAGITQLRLWGLDPGAVQTAEEIGATAERAGLTDVRVQRCGEKVIGPALRLTRERLGRMGAGAVPIGHRTAARALLSQVELLWRRGMIDYVLLTARAPS
jgi:SAM-dependent methyltransferase